MYCTPEKEKESMSFKCGKFNLSRSVPAIEPPGIFFKRNDCSSKVVLLGHLYCNDFINGLVTVTRNPDYIFNTLTHTNDVIFLRYYETILQIIAFP